MIVYSMSADFSLHYFENESLNFMIKCIMSGRSTQSSLAKVSTQHNSKTWLINLMTIVSVENTRKSILLRR